MTIDVKAFFQATNPGIPLFIDNVEIDKKYYIDFSTVRGGKVIKKLKNTITLWSSDQPTCQLFTGHIGCGKSTELWQLKQQLETEGFHVVYFESDKSLEMGDVDIGDIFLTIAQQVSRSLEKLEKLNLEEPKGLKGLLQGAAKLLQTEIELSAEANIPGMGKVAASSEGSFSAEVGLPGVGQVKADEKGLEFVALGIGKITAQAKASPELRTKLREYLGPRTSGIIETINKELLEPANEKLKKYGKKGLVVIVDNLEKVDSSPKPWGRPQPEYLFVDRGEQLMSLHCHLIYTLPMALRFSNDYDTLTQRFKKDPQILPMVATQLRDGSECAEGMKLMRQLVLARAFPELDPQQRLAKVTEIFDSQETLDYLCRFSGGHVRNVLRIVNEAIMEEGDLPISRASVANVIKTYRNQRLLAVDDHEWELLRRVVQTKKVTGDDGYQILIRSMFVYEYQDELGPWFDINPLLKDAPELNIRE
ncbi:MULTISPECIES: ATP-binding protein [Okeania]|uniref:ATP-binding protein n=1 Tax=Okeania TaxID=1458928 RepID=UPI000F525DBA|nr:MULTISPECIES: ATP-binding protein [Okeania]NES76081.1 ATP-binding protein [Okeania sp. SIO1H4]NET21486.1 ATP-binding protein [Okeania sp. SIO1H5]NET94279.1 ATP-binding protein [Okeania sp. SIO1H2]RQH17067.1 ATP-binding protein [Okeania hirsuta]